MRDTQVFDFKKKDSIFEEVRKILNTPDMKAKMKRLDILYDLCGFAIFLFHIFLSFYGVYYEILPAWLMVILFTATRTSMASVGHYHCHRGKNGILDWGDALFDMQYVGASAVSFDGHVLLHHAQANGHQDPKRTVFTGLLELPRLWRVPAETLRRWAHAITGMTIRWFIFVFVENGPCSFPFYKNV
jgi:hypothetical protein